MFVCKNRDSFFATGSPEAAREAAQEFSGLCG